jgi:hypothetical protein
MKSERRIYEGFVLPTIYNGIKFKSRTEAKWAVYFDQLKLKYVYEKEGFNLGNGIYYLPDFWLSDVKMWAEVKPDEFTPEEYEKAKRLAILTGFPVLMLIDSPACKPYLAIISDKDEKDETYEMDYALSNYDDYPKGEGRFYICTGCPLEPSKQFNEFFPDTINAVKYACFGYDFNYKKEKDTDGTDKQK